MPDAAARGGIGPAVGAAALGLVLLLPAGGPGAWAGPAALLLFAALSRPGWRGKASARMAGLLLLAALLLLMRSGDWLIAFGPAGLGRYRSVMLLLFGMALLQRVFKRLDLAAPLLRALRASGPAAGLAVLMATAALLALPLSLATVALMTGLLAGVLNPPLTGASVSMRMVALTMVLLPTTVASASVSASVPGLQTMPVLQLGGPVFLAGVLLNLRLPLRLRDGAAPAGPAAAPSAGPVVLAFAGLLVLAGRLGADVPSAVGFSGIGVYAFDAWRQRQSLGDSAQQAGQALAGGSAEVLLLAACGLFAHALSRAGALPPTLASALQMLWSWPGAALTLVLVVLPLLAMAGLHPLILFNLVFPLVDNRVLGEPAAQYLAWVTMFIAAQLLSPVSISALLAAGALGVPPAQTSYRLHWRYAAAVSACTALVLMASDGGRHGLLPPAF